MRTKLWLLMLMSALAFSSYAQNWLTTGNSGITSSNFLGSTNAADLIFKANNIERGRILNTAGTWRFGGATNFAKIDSTGKLSFGGTGAYQVAGNKYAFQYAGNPNYGLFFNTTNVQYEFRNGSATPVFFINANNGNGVFNGTLKVGAYTLPATDGTSGQVLKTNGTGILTWSNDNGGAGSGWSLTGNAGTNPATNFIGTKDAQSLVFKVNNLRAGLIDYSTCCSGTRNTAFGLIALNSNTSGADNTANGYGTLYSNQTGNENSALGKYALFNNNGNDNSAFGFNAMFFNTTGTNNSAVGVLALQNNVTGGYNTAVGSNSLVANNSGSSNTALGYTALYNNYSGQQNTATGVEALYSNTTGNYNTASGVYSLLSNTTGNNNSAEGYYALVNNISGNNNIANGYSALLSNTSGHSNIGIGTSALYYNDVSSNLVAIGDSAMYFNGKDYGQGAGSSNRNTGVGSKVLFSSFYGSDNTGVGYQSLYSATGGNSNTAVGSQSLYSNLNANDNTAVGFFSLYSNTYGHDNTAMGSLCLGVNDAGNYNTAFGSFALGNNIEGSYNTAIGYFADVQVNAVRYMDATAIGYGAIIYQSNQVRVGDASVSSIGGQVGWTTFSDGRYKRNIKHDVKGLDFINSLQPITYTVDINGLSEYYNKGRKHDSGYEKVKKDMQPSADEASKIVYNGFIAQDVEASAKKLNYEFNGVDKPKSKDGLYGLRYAEFVVPLVKAVQELSQQNEDIKKENEELKARLDKLEALLSQQSSQSVELSDKAMLEQNIPNPAKGTTTIRYSVPSYISSAYINVYSSSNTLIRSIKISSKGSGSVDLKISELSSGVYQYTLIVDGKVIDKKQMVITR